MQLYNTLSKQIDAFEPLKKNTVSIYSCGPTVYDHIHIGNLRAFVTADTLRRVLANAGYLPKHVMNFTDVDDKTISRSQTTYPDDAPEAALTQLTRTYEDIFLQDMTAIGNDVEALDFIRATESIDGMKELITKLHTAGIAYIADDGVYFSIAKYRKSGKKYGQLLQIYTKDSSEARINNDEYDKDSPHDFALWKTVKPGEPAWSFELDGHDLLGRPGWHIECSAMSSDNLGQPFDIHTGGVDLIFPHHENEIAQSTGAIEGKDYAKYFVHNEHLLVEGRKMSKSLNNFFTLRDIQEKGFEPLAFRMLVLQAHYRNQLNFSWDGLEAAKNRLERWRNLAVLRFQAISDAGEAKTKETIERALEAAEQALQKDLDTPRALTHYETAFAAIEQGVGKGVIQTFEKLLSSIDTELGLDLLSQKDLAANQKTLLAERQKARDTKDWAAADKVRDELQAAGIQVRDTAHGQIWSR